MHAPEYAAENGAALRQGWPRIPLPASRSDLLASADLGRRVAAMLDPETPVSGVTAGKVRPELRLLGSATRNDGGQLSRADFAVTARWGIAGKGGITMPSTGRLIERRFTADEAVALGEVGVSTLGPPFLVFHDKVQEELKLSDEQKQKLQKRLQATVQDAMQFFHKLADTEPEEREQELHAYGEKARDNLTAFLQGLLQGGQFKRLRQVTLQRDRAKLISEGVYTPPLLPYFRGANRRSKERAEFVRGEFGTG